MEGSEWATLIVSVSRPSLVLLRHLKIRIQLLQGIVRVLHSDYKSIREVEVRTYGRLCRTVDASELHSPQWDWMGGVDNGRDSMLCS